RSGAPFFVADAEQIRTGRPRNSCARAKLSTPGQFDSFSRFAGLVWLTDSGGLPGHPKGRSGAVYRKRAEMHRVVVWSRFRTAKVGPTLAGNALGQIIGKGASGMRPARFRKFAGLVSVSVATSALFSASPALAAPLA